MNLSEQSTDFFKNYLRLFRKNITQYNLTESQALCLISIPFNGISQTRLSHNLSLNISTVSRNLSHLIKVDLIIKKKSNHTIDINKLPISQDNISNFDLLTQILPPLSLKYKTKKFKEDDNYKTSNNVLEIVNGVYIRGQIEKGVLGDGSKVRILKKTNEESEIQ